MKDRIIKAINNFLSLNYEERNYFYFNNNNYEEMVIIKSFVKATVRQDKNNKSVRGHSIRVEEEKNKLINIVYEELSKPMTDRLGKLKKI